MQKEYDIHFQKKIYKLICNISFAGQYIYELRHAKRVLVVILIKMFIFLFSECTEKAIHVYEIKKSRAHEINDKTLYVLNMTPYACTAQKLFKLGNTFKQTRVDFLPRKYDVISQLRNSYAKGPFCMTRHL